MDKTRTSYPSMIHKIVTYEDMTLVAMLLTILAGQEENN